MGRTIRSSYVLIDRQRERETEWSAVSDTEGERATNGHGLSMTPNQGHQIWRRQGIRTSELTRQTSADCLAESVTRSSYSQKGMTASARHHSTHGYINTDQASRAVRSTQSVSQTRKQDDTDRQTVIIDHDTHHTNT